MNRIAIFDFYCMHFPPGRGRLIGGLGRVGYTIILREKLYKKRLEVILNESKKKVVRALKYLSCYNYFALSITKAGVIYRDYECPAPRIRVAYSKEVVRKGYLRRVSLKGILEGYLSRVSLKGTLDGYLRKSLSTFLQ